MNSIKQFSAETLINKTIAVIDFKTPESIVITLNDGSIYVMTCNDLYSGDALRISISPASTHMSDLLGVRILDVNTNGYSTTIYTTKGYTRFVHLLETDNGCEFSLRKEPEASYTKFDEKTSHYIYIEKYGRALSVALDLGYHNIATLLVKHDGEYADMQRLWSENEIPFAKGVVLYLMSYLLKYNNRVVRQTFGGTVYVSPKEWVITMYNKPEIRKVLDQFPSYY